MTPFELALLAGGAAGLGGARLRNPTDPGRLPGTIGFLAAAPGVLLLTANVGAKVNNKIFDLTGLAATAPLLGLLFLLAAACAGCVHLLGVLAADDRIRNGVVAVAVLAGAVMVWQWLTKFAHPKTDVPADIRWYLLAMLVGLALPLLVVVVLAVRHRVITAAVWATVLAVGAAAGILWCLVRTTEIFSPDTLGDVANPIKWALVVVLVAGLWAGNWMAAEAEVAAAAQAEQEALEAEAAALAAALADEEEFAKPAQEPEKEPADPVAARARAVAVAAALARQLDEVGRDTAVAVGVNGDEVVFCTADGLGFLPEGGKGAADLTPLIMCVPPDFVTRWMGCAHPQMALLAAAEQGYIDTFDAVATVGPGGDLTIEDLGGIDIEELTAARSTTDAISVSQTPEVLAQLRVTWNVGSEDDPADLADAVSARRWTTWPDPDYPHAWAAELLARAAVDLESGDVSSARYVLACAVRIPPPVSVPVSGAPVALPVAITPPVEDEPEEPVSVPEPILPERAPAHVPSPGPGAGLMQFLDREPLSSSVTPAETSAAPPALATSIAAALAQQIRGDADIAVAVGADGKAVFATSDGLGFLPDGATTSSRLTALVTAVDDDFLARWLGCGLPHVALVAAANAGLIPAPVEIVTTCANSSSGAVVSVSDEDLAAADPYPLGRARELSDFIEAADVVNAYSDVTGIFGFPSRTPEVAEREAAALRWNGAPNAEYALAWARYLIAASEDAVSRRDENSARYLLRNALRIPAPVKK